MNNNLKYRGEHMKFKYKLIEVGCANAYLYLVDLLITLIYKS